MSDKTKTPENLLPPVVCETFYIFNPRNRLLKNPPTERGGLRENADDERQQTTSAKCVSCGDSL